jgi:hypothetical protein
MALKFQNYLNVSDPLLDMQIDPKLALGFKKFAPVSIKY